jgi:hypothetical protein
LDPYKFCSLEAKKGGGEGCNSESGYLSPGLIGKSMTVSGRIAATKWTEDTPKVDCIHVFVRYNVLAKIVDVVSEASKAGYHDLTYMWVPMPSGTTDIMTCQTDAQGCSSPL